MTILQKQCVGVALLGLFFSSCAEEGPPRKETYPVTGQIFVDGEPAADLAVTCHNVEGMDKEQPTMSTAVTDKEGKFAISTYEMADGVPKGEYVLTFMWGKRNLVTMNYGGPDKLNDRYTDPKTSELRFQVEPGTPTDLGRIDLTAE